MAVDPGTYIPDVEIQLEGRALSALLRTHLTSIRLDAGLEGADRAELQFANPGLRFLEPEPVSLDAPLEIALGYRPSRFARLFSGAVTGFEPSFPADGVPMLTVSALGHLHRLRTATKERAFPYYLPDSVIASIIAAEHGLISVPDAAATVASAIGISAERPRIQHQQSDEALLRAIAAEYGFDLWVDGDVLNLQLSLPQLPSPCARLHWGESLLEFEPRLTSVGQLAAITARVWVEALKLQIAVTVAWEDGRITVRVAPALFGSAEDGAAASLSLPDLPLDSPQDAIRWALGELRRRLNTRVTARGRVVGDPRLRVGEVIAVEGVGPTFSGGSYRLTAVSHTLDAGGYRTGFEARKEVL